MWKRYLWIKNIIFLIASSYLMANIVQTIILSRLPKSNLLEINQAKASSPDLAAKSLNTYSLISRKNIFNSQSSGDTASGQGKGQKSNEPLKKTELNIKLVGTVVGSHDSSFAIIEDNSTQKQELYQIDDMLQDQARIVNIERCRLIVVREGQQEVLECLEQEEKGKPVSKTVAYAAPSSNYSGVKKLSESDYLVDEKEVENALTNINQLMTQIRIVPNFQDGKTNGFKVFAIKPDSVFATIGLKNGDIIQKVNERDLTTPDKAFQSFQELRNERNLSLEITRSGERKTLNYQIR